MRTSILVIGGGGYIGSHMVKMLCERGYGVTVLDNFSTGHRDAIVGGSVITGDIGDQALLRRVFREHRFDAVMHFAGLIEVSESVREPAMYYHNNMVKTLTLLGEMQRHEVDKFVFSSTAAVYGASGTADLREDCAAVPINPYGRSKQFVEEILRDFDQAYGLRSVCLRYFNAAGADPAGQLGERHEPETHLIPLVLQTAAGRRDHITIFGDDYETRDGTCVRDFVHVHDLCEAHERALSHLMSGGGSDRLNLGCNSGYSVRQVVETACAVTGLAVPVEVAARRPGDPDRLVADTHRARERLAWAPQFDLEDMIMHAWRWELERGRGVERQVETG